MLLQLININQRFDYFSEIIESQSHQKLLLTSILQPKSQLIHQNLKIQNQVKHEQIIQKRKHKIISSPNSYTERTNKSFQQSVHEEKLLKINRCFQNMSIDKILLYHKTKTSIRLCFGYQRDTYKFINQSQLGDQIIKSILTQLQLTANNEKQKKVLYFKRKLGNQFFVSPLYQRQKLSGFVQIYMNKKQKKNLSENQNLSFNQKNAYINAKQNKNYSLVTEGVIQIFMEIYSYTNQNNKQIRGDAVCQYCQKEKIINYIQNFPLNFESSQNQKVFGSKDKFRNLIKLQSLSQFLLQIKDTFTNTNSNETFYSIEENIYQFLQKECKIFRQNKKQSLQKQCKNQHKQIKELIQKEFLLRIFYVKSPKTKDRKGLNRKDKTQKEEQNLFYCFNNKAQNQQQQFFNLKIDFIDTLQQFVFQKSLSDEKSPPSIEISITKLIQIYKNLIRKNKQNSKIKNNNKNLINLDQPSSILTSEESNYLLFFQELLKSITYKNSLQNLDTVSQYHTLQLLLYQLENFNKNQQNGLRVVFKVNYFPIFTHLNQGKQNYLTAFIFLGGFQFQYKKHQEYIFHQTNFNLYKTNNILEYLNEIIQPMRTDLLSKIFQIKLFKQKIIYKQTSNKQKQTNQQPQINFAKLLQKKFSIKLEQNILNESKNFNNNQKKMLKFRNIFINATISLENLLKTNKKHKISKKVIQSFCLNSKNIKFKLLNSMMSILNLKIGYKLYNKKHQILSNSLLNIKHYCMEKSQHYKKYSAILLKKMNQIFIINKILFLPYCKIKQSSINFKINSKTNDQINQKLVNQISINRQFSTKRFVKILHKIVFGEIKKVENIFENSGNSLIFASFNKLKEFIKNFQQISVQQKKQSVYRFVNSLKNIFCGKIYIPYFKKLQFLQNYLEKSISLIGTQIQSIQFYTFYDFLKFINQRVSIIIQSQQKLISILYGKIIKNVYIWIEIQNQINNTNCMQQSKVAFQIKISQKNQEKIVFQVNQNQKNSLKVVKIKVQQQNQKIIYLNFTIVTNQIQDKKEKESQNLANFYNLFKKVIEDKVSQSLKRFYQFFMMKIKTFCMKVNNNLRIQNKLRKGEQKSIKNYQDLQIKKFVFKKLQNNFLRCQKFTKARCLEIEIQRKNKQLQQHQIVYTERQKKLMQSQCMDKQIKVSKKDQTEINTQQGKNQAIKNDEKLKQSVIITKGMIKQLKHNIENMDLNSQNLSIQYQIKSKTVAGYQVMGILEKIKRKQALLQVRDNLLVLQMNQKVYQNDKSQRLPLESVNLINKDQLLNGTYNIIPDTKSLVTDQKQTINYLKTFYQEQKTFFNQKFKNKSINIMIKVIKNVNRSFYKISFNKLKINNMNVNEKYIKQEKNKNYTKINCDSFNRKVL